MVQYRTQLKIVTDVLSTAKDMNSDGTGVGVTILLRRANMPYSRMSKLLADLVGSGLLVELGGDKASKYMISEKGVHFLAQCHSFEDFAQSFGLRL